MIDVAELSTAERQQLHEREAEQVCFVIYEPTTGKIRQAGVTDRKTFPLQAQPGMGLLEVDAEIFDPDSFRVSGDRLVQAPPAFDLERARQEACAAIDRAAELVRESFVTPGSGQAMVYLEKRQEAELVVAAANPEDVSPQLAPHICREAEDTGSSKFDIAVTVLTLAEQWRTISPMIESLRMGAKRAVAEAETAEAISQARAIDWTSVRSLAP